MPSQTEGSGDTPLRDSSGEGDGGVLSGPWALHCRALSRVPQGGERRWSPGEEDEAHGRGSW